MATKESNLTIKKHQSDNMEEKQRLDNLEDKSKSVDFSRRRFAKTGLAASGVILTLTSRPVLGNFGVCKSPSGFLSGNASGRLYETACYGLSPGFWANHPEKWGDYDPGKYVINGPSVNTNDVGKWTGGTRFTDAFTGSLYFGEHTLMQVLWMTGVNDPYQIGAHSVAALLNASNGFTPPLDAMQVIDMFLEWELQGYYEPTAGVQWYGFDIVTYIQSTFS